MCWIIILPFAGNLADFLRAWGIFPLGTECVE